MLLCCPELILDSDRVKIFTDCTDRGQKMLCGNSSQQSTAAVSCCPTAFPKNLRAGCPCPLYLHEKGRNDSGFGREQNPCVPSREHMMREPLWSQHWGFCVRASSEDPLSISASDFCFFGVVMERERSPLAEEVF